MTQECLVQTCAVERKQILSSWIIELGQLQMFIFLLEMNHATMHGKSVTQNGIGKTGKTGMVESVDASLREGEID
jgi:hypothetical protein